MNQTDIYRLGTIAFFLLFAIKFYIAVVDTAFYRAGRVAILWTTMYVFFLAFLRVLLELKVATSSELRVVSSIAVFIPLIGVIAQLYLTRKVRTSTDAIEQLVKRELKIQGIKKRGGERA